MFNLRITSASLTLPNLARWYYGAINFFLTRVESLNSQNGVNVMYCPSRRGLLISRINLLIYSLSWKSTRRSIWSYLLNIWRHWECAMMLSQLRTLRLIWNPKERFRMRRIVSSLLEYSNWMYRFNFMNFSYHSTYITVLLQILTRGKCAWSCEITDCWPSPPMTIRSDSPLHSLLRKNKSWSAHPSLRIPLKVSKSKYWFQLTSKLYQTSCKLFYYFDSMFLL